MNHQPEFDHTAPDCGCAECTHERLAYCLLARGSNRHHDQNHFVVGCPGRTGSPPCPLCSDPHGAHMTGTVHTLTPGCDVYEHIFAQVGEAMRDGRIGGTSDLCDTPGCDQPGVLLVANDAPVTSPEYSEARVCRWHRRNPFPSASARAALTEIECTGLAEVLGSITLTPEVWAAHMDRIAGEVGEIVAARLRGVADLANRYDENGRARTPKPPWAHIATEVRNTAFPLVIPPGTPTERTADEH